ncbi:MAG: hypothetical protein V3S00_01790 [Dehalococcoidia bacterium]
MGESDLASIRREKVAFIYQSLTCWKRQKALETNKAVIIVSHDHRIRDIADRVVRLEDGRLQAKS